MGHSQAEKARSHDRILSIAARTIRDSGSGSLVIADLMKAAGLTHGAFYSHFDSRDALIEESIERALSEGEAKFSSESPGNVREMTRSYLSKAHRDHPETGCVMATLAMETRRTRESRQLLADRLDRYIDRLAWQIGGEDATDKALATWSMLVGAVTLSRLFEGDPSDRLLVAARGAIDKILDADVARPRDKDPSADGGR